MPSNTTTVGAFPPPPGKVPNFEHPTDASMREEFLIWLIVTYVLTVGFCAVRAYVKASRWEMLPDDWLCIAAWAFITATLAGNVMTWIYGMGYHSWEVTKEVYIEFSKWIYIGSALYIPSVFTTKAAILVLLARIFAVHHLAARAIHVLILLLFLTLLPIEGLKLGVCRPVSAYWTLATSSAQLAARCVDQGTLFKADITVAILTDFMILLIPIPFVFSLSFSLGKKIRILLSLATGGGAVGVALYKGILVFSPSPEQDPTKDFAILSVLSFLEMNIGLMCACLPSVTILLDKIRNSSQRRHGYSKSSSFHRRRRKGGGMVLGLSSFDVRRKRKQDVLAGGESSDPSSTTGGTITTFNMELAVLAGQTDVELCANNGKGFPAEESGVGVQVDAQGRCVRIDSMQGRSEGWLAPAPV